MQSAPIRDRAHRAPEPVPHAQDHTRVGARVRGRVRGRVRRVAGRLPGALLRGSARAGVVAGLAFTGWLLLSAPGADQASASAEAGPAGHGDTAGRPLPALPMKAAHASGETLTRTAARTATRTAARTAQTAVRTAVKTTVNATGRTAERTTQWAAWNVDAWRTEGLRASSSTVASLVDEVSERSGLSELRPAGTALLTRAVLPDDRHTVDRLLSPLTARPTRLGGLGALLGTGTDAVDLPITPGGEDAQPSPAATGDGSAAAPVTGPGMSAGMDCRSCARSGHEPSRPQAPLPTGQGDTSAAFLHTGYGPGLLTGTLTSPVDTAHPTADVTALPAAAMRDKSAPARPMAVPD